MQTLRGIPASEGIAIGIALVYRPETVAVSRYTVADVQSELARWRDVVERAKDELLALQDETRAAVSEETACIFGAQRLMLEDPELQAGVEKEIIAGVNVEAALVSQVDRYAAILSNLDSEYLRQRAVDVRDVGQRVLRILAGIENNPLTGLRSPAVVFAQDLTPAESVQLNRDVALGFVTARGGATSHTAILARGLGLPAVVGVGESLLQIVAPGERVIVDGHAGLVIVDPDTATLETYTTRRSSCQIDLQEAKTTALKPAITADGQRVLVAANVGDVESARWVLNQGAEGVGLLRTEFLFLNRNTMPGEEEQYAAYLEIAQTMGDRPLIIRLLDVGGDKPLSCWQQEKEANPFLGLRAIRLLLAHPEVLRTQLRAILRAAAGPNVKILLPMVTALEEVRAARRVLEEARTELENRGDVLGNDVQVGIMVEVPSVAVCAPLFAREVDFFSIGTNDLTQYTLAADRTNQKVGYLYDSLHPAVLQLIQRVIDSAHQAGKWVGMCGEVACDPDAIPILLGMGLDEFSVSGARIPEVKALIRRLDRSSTQCLATQALELSSAVEIRALAKDFREHSQTT